MPDKSATLDLAAWLDKADPLMEEFGVAAAKLEKKRARLEKELACIRAEYEPEISEAEQSVASLTAKIEILAEAHKDEFPAGRSYRHAGVEMGFRQTPPRVHIKRNFAEIALTWLLKKFGEDRYVRVKREINKETVRDTLAEAGRAGDSSLLGEFRERGITLKQDDNFFVEVQRAE